MAVRGLVILLTLMNDAMEETDGELWVYMARVWNAEMSLMIL